MLPVDIAQSVWLALLVLFYVLLAVRQHYQAKRIAQLEARARASDAIAQGLGTCPDPDAVLRELAARVEALEARE
jgi:hypothetical protein